MLEKITRLRWGIKEQDALYDQYVTPHLEDDTLEHAYQYYVKSLDHFDIRAFRKTVNAIMQDPEALPAFTDKFQSIPDYVEHRNNFDEKRKDILQMDGTPKEKQAIFDTLDRNRTRAHNRVIDLFNSLNRYAESHNIAYPYPNNGESFNPANLDDRETVARVLGRQEPLLETINHFVQENTTEKESLADKFRSMSLKELKDYASDKLLAKSVAQLGQEGLVYG